MQITLLASHKKLLAFFTSLKKIALDGLFPIHCLGCNTLDHWICPECHTTLPVVTEQCCPLCKKHTTINGEVCHACTKHHNNSFDGVFVASYYKDRLLKKVIHYYKYRFVHDLADPLALLLAQSLQNSTLPSPDIVIPVPLHKRRLRWRGFNQAEKLAHSLDLRIPVITDILLRVRYTKPQASTKNKGDRERNLNSAFSVHNKKRVGNKNILLIDDVMTTGTTLKECASTLKDAGAKNVYCIVLTRE